MSVQIRLLKDIDFQGVIRKAGTVVEAEENSRDFAVQMGIGSFIYLTPGIEAEIIQPPEAGKPTAS